MDFDFASSQFVDLLFHPSEVGRTTKIRKQIKNQWARDDPAFLVLLIAMIFLSVLAYCVCFVTLNPLHILRLLLGSLLLEFAIGGAALTTAIRWYINKNMRIQRIHTVEQSIEWLYAFDIHCNALFTSFILITIGQYILIPIIINNTNLLSTILSNTLWMTGIGYYAYITFLGYSGNKK